MRETIIKILDTYGETYNSTDSDSTLISVLDGSSRVDWHYISECPTLSEEFIREFKDSVDWMSISTYQRLSEDFIREVKDKVDGILVSQYQTLSENFIRELQDRVDWYYVSIYQELSEDFIREFQDKVNWSWISVSQELSEDFIREFKDKVDWHCIRDGQKLSDSFCKEFSLTKPSVSTNWLYATKEYKLDYIKKNTKYEVIDDDYIIAYIPEDARYSVAGETHERHCFYRRESSPSSVLAAYTENSAKGRFPTLKKVRIQIEDVGVVDAWDRMHCSRWTVLSENSTSAKETCPRCSIELIEKTSQNFFGSTTYIVKKCPNCGYCG